MAQERKEECRQIITDLESRGYLEPEAEKIKAELDLKMAGEASRRCAVSASSRRGRAA